METITSDYLYADIFYDFTRFFNNDIMREKSFLTQFAKGMMPRRFDSDND